jgi:hypothetical protein
MGAETTQLRISKTLNTRLARLSNDLKVAPDPTVFTKEQLASAFLSECLDAVSDTRYSDAPLPCISHIRKKLQMPGKTVDEIVASKVDAAIATKLDAAIEQRLQRGTKSPKALAKAS